jgi:hypothetical protein
MDTLLLTYIRPLLTENLGWVIAIIIIYYNIKTLNIRIDTVERNIKDELNNGLRSDIRVLKEYQEGSRALQNEYIKELSVMKAKCEERHKRDINV